MGGNVGGLGVVYRVRKGDTLWDIAEAELGSPWEWPRLYAFNNRGDVLLSGVRRITNPDLIYAGEVIRIPRAEGWRSGLRNFSAVAKGKSAAGGFSAVATAPSATPGGSAPGGTATGAVGGAVPRRSGRMLPQGGAGVADPGRPTSLRDQIPHTYVPFAIAYELADLPEIKLRYPGFTMSIKLAGRVTIELGQKVPLTYVASKGFETSLKTRTDHALGELVSQTSARFNPATKEVSFSNKLISSSHMSGAPKTAIGVSVSSSKPLPVIRAEIEYASLRARSATISSTRRASRSRWRSSSTRRARNRAGVTSRSRRPAWTSC